MVTQCAGGGGGGGGGSIQHTALCTAYMVFICLSISVSYLPESVVNFSVARILPLIFIPSAVSRGCHVPKNQQLPRKAMKQDQKLRNIQLIITAILSPKFCDSFSSKGDPNHFLLIMPVVNMRATRYHCIQFRTLSTSGLFWVEDYAKMAFRLDSSSSGSRQ